MNAIEIYDLIPKNGRKSFYGKARVIDDGNRRYLRSYDTIMGWIDGNGCHRCSDYRSMTTNCHIKSFFPSFVDFWKLPLEEKPEIHIVL